MSNELLKYIDDPETNKRYIIGDTSLSEAGVAADAKVVGDEIDFNSAPIKTDVTYSIEDGYYDANGRPASASSYWKEQRTTKVNVENIKNIKYVFSCETSTTQSGIVVDTWSTDGAFIGRTQLVEQGVFTKAHGYFNVTNSVGYVAFHFGTRGYEVSFDITANYDYGKCIENIAGISSAVFPAPTYTIDDGYYDANGRPASASSYWQEGLTSKICVDNVKSVGWKYHCDSLFTQNNIVISKWAEDGTFIERANVHASGTYSDASGTYHVESGVRWVAFHFSTRGYTCTFDINNIIDYLDITSDITLLKEKAGGTDVISANQDALSKIISSRWMEDDTALPVSLLWFSDIHRKDEPLKRILEFKSHLEDFSLIEDTIVTGDIVLSSSEETTQFANFWTNNPGTDDILIACGNHEWYANTSQPHTKMTVAQIDAMYFNDTSDWDITRSGTNPFYYKDYEDQKVRLIVVDPAVTDEEADETTWLSGVLADAITNEYAVIIATHFLRGTLTIYDNCWTEVDKRDLETFTQGYDWAGCDIISCVSTFISNGGTFICYLQGHTHRDFLGYPVGHPEQLVVSLASASWGRSETPLRMNDLPRYAGTRTMDCFNVVTIDSNRGVLKCVRVGANVNMLEETRTAFSYDYNANQFISTM